MKSPNTWTIETQERLTDALDNEQRETHTINAHEGDEGSGNIQGTQLERVKA